jgi:hypothetical protein
VISEAGSWPGQSAGVLHLRFASVQDDKGVRAWMETETALEVSGKKAKRGAALSVGMTNQKSHSPLRMTERYSLSTSNFVDGSKANPYRRSAALLVPFPTQALRPALSNSAPPALLVWTP